MGTQRVAAPDTRSFGTDEAETGTRISDREIGHVLDNVGLVLDILSTLPQSAEVRVLSDGAAALDATVRSWMNERPSDKVLADVKRELLVLKDATSTLRARIDELRQAVMRMLKTRSSLTLLEIKVLLRYHNHPAADWDLGALHDVLAMDPWLSVDGQTVCVATLA